MKQDELSLAWSDFVGMMTESEKIAREAASRVDEGVLIREEGRRMYVEGERLRPAGREQRDAGEKMYVDGSDVIGGAVKIVRKAMALSEVAIQQWEKAILELRGNCTATWKKTKKVDSMTGKEVQSLECHLETGEVFEM